MKTPVIRPATLAAICASLSLTLAGCSTSPPVRYFSLEPVYDMVNSVDDQQPIVGLGQLRTPNFLFRSQLVTRERGGELVVHDFRRWSEPLDQAIHRVVAANTDSLVGDMTVIAFPYESRIQPAYRVHGNVERFDADTRGEAVLIVQWSITSGDGAVVTPPRRNRYAAQAASAEDPADVVAALNEVLGAFSRDIAGRLDAI
jgi:uncharacterized lipoprotein YmbA